MQAVSTGATDGRSVCTRPQSMTIQNDSHGYTFHPDYGAPLKIGRPVSSGGRKNSVPN